MPLMEKQHIEKEYGSYEEVARAFGDCSEIYVCTHVSGGEPSHYNMCRSAAERDELLSSPYLTKAELAWSKAGGAVIPFPSSETATPPSPEVEPAEEASPDTPSLSPKEQRAHRMKKKSAGRTAVIGAGFLVLAFISSAIQTETTPTTKVGAILPGLITGLAALAAIILFIVAIAQAIRNRNAK